MKWPSRGRECPEVQTWWIEYVGGLAGIQRLEYGDVIELIDGDTWIEGGGSTESQRKGKQRFEPTL